MKRSVFLFIGVMCFATAGLGASSKKSKIPTNKNSDLVSISKEPQIPTVHYALITGAALGGPVVYDRLAVANGTGALVRDPALLSLTAGLEIMQDHQSGSSFLYGYGRQFQQVQNASEGRYSSSPNANGPSGAAEPALSEEIQIDAHGFGLMIGWQFRARSPQTTLFPRAAIGYEEDVVTVQGKQTSTVDGIRTEDDIGIKGKIQIATGLIGLRWNWVSTPFLMGMNFDLVGPIAGQKSLEPQNNAASISLTDDLHFGSRLGGAVTFFLGL